MRQPTLAAAKKKVAEFAFMSAADVVFAA